MCLYKYQLDTIKPTLLQPAGFRSDIIALYSIFVGKEKFQLIVG